MTTSQTLFGGLALVGLIYYGLRFLRISNYWAAVTAAGIPIAFYLALKAGRWPGGDQLAMHIAAYIAAATGLAMIGLRQNSDKRRMHWAPRALIIFFLILFVINASLMTIATKGLPPSLARLLLPGDRAETPHTAFPGVVPHGGGAAKTISSELKARQRLAELGWRLEVTGLSGWRAAAPQTVRLAIRAPLPPRVNAKLELRRSGEAAAGISQPFTALGGADYALTLNAPSAGAWQATLLLDTGTETLRFEHALEIAA